MDSTRFKLINSSWRQRTHVYGLDLSNKPGKKQWIKSQELASLELPADTLLEVNVVKEYEGEVRRRASQEHR